MIKKFTLFLLMIVFLGKLSLGQTASLENKTAFPNTTTEVALNIGNFTNISSCKGNIRNIYGEPY